MKKTIKIKFVDFYPNFIPNKSSLWACLWERYEVVLSDEPQWLVFSVFGNEHLKYNNCVKIFYTGENQTPDFNLCDYALGFDYMGFGDRYMRFPLWMLYTKDIGFMLHKHEHPLIEQKTDFCSFVVSNPHSMRHEHNSWIFCRSIRRYIQADVGAIMWEDQLRIS